MRAPTFRSITLSNALAALVWLGGCMGTTPGGSPAQSGGSQATGGAPNTGGATASGGIPGTGGDASPGGGTQTTGGNEQPATPGNVLKIAVPAVQQLEFDSAIKRMAALQDETADSLVAKRTPQTPVELDHSAGTAENLQLIQSSALALNAAELERLEKLGFVISSRHAFPSFGYGYETLYGEDLPLYVSLDSVLEAVHRSYDDILQGIEEQALIPELASMLESMHVRLADAPPAGLSGSAAQDADLYLSVARSLISGATVAPVAGAPADLIATTLGDAEAATGWLNRELFGVQRRIDFSQFTPRGHYTNSDALKRYFRAMMWLGRIDFRLIETNDAGEAIFHRRQLESALAMGALMDDTAQASWRRIDDVIKAFVGESDSMVVPELVALRSDLQIDALSDLASQDDETIVAAIIDGNYGTQRISSHIMINGGAVDTLPLSRSFLVFGQRYVVDSHVFSNVVYDRLQPSESGGPRMMPNPLDVGYAVFENDRAAALLANELKTFEYAPELESMRLMVAEHGEGYWNKNLYNLRLKVGRGMSASQDTASGDLPLVMQTEAWKTRVLNTQLASWAELRHDTILYAKQSYTGGISCEFPDAYVDPYPQSWAALVRYAEQGASIVSGLNFPDSAWSKERMTDYFVQLQSIAGTLQEMAEYERAGTPFSVEHMTFINEAVTLNRGCGGPTSISGWFGRLYFNNEGAGDSDPVIADVHTQPTDESGSPVGRVLHVGTGLPRLMVVTTNTCNGPRAYAGLASAYHERITENFDRLTDERWAADIAASGPADVPWMTPILSPTP